MFASRDGLSAPRSLGKIVRRDGMGPTSWHVLRRIGMARGRAWTGPRTLHLMPLQFLCNHACPMCNLQELDPRDLRSEVDKEQSGGLTVEEYERLFDDMLPGLRTVSLFGGGEPLAYKGIERLLASIKKRGWKGSVITNGALLRPALAESMVRSGWEHLRISLHAGDAATYRVVHARDNFGRTMQNLEHWNRLRNDLHGGSRRRPRLTLHNVVQRENLAGIEAIFEVAERLECDELSFTLIIPYEPRQELTPGELEFARACLAACTRASAIPVVTDPVLQPVAAIPAVELDGDSEIPNAPEGEDLEESFRPARACTVGYDYAVVSAFGDVTPCCYSDEILGNIRERSFREVWHGTAYHEFRNRLANGEFAPYCASNRCAIAEVLKY